MTFTKPTPIQTPSPSQKRTSSLLAKMGSGSQENLRDFAEYQRKIVNNLGYFAMSRTKVGKIQEQVAGKGEETFKDYNLEPTSLIAQYIYWFFYVNTAIKAVFLAFLVTEYFGPVEFLDKIAALDYILCVGIVTFGSCIWFLRYPIYEILHSFWTIENNIFTSLGLPEELNRLVDKRHHATVWIHLCIVWFGCSVLVTQFYADPKYCVWTYSALQEDNFILRLVFVSHEFFFMMHPWNNMTGSSSLCTFQGIVLANLIDRMTEVLEGFRFQELRRSKGYSKNGEVVIGRSDISAPKGKLEGFREHNDNVIHDIPPDSTKTAVGKQFSAISGNPHAYDTVDKLIFDYKQLMIISEQFNAWVSYKIVFLHACGYCQFISDVFVAMQVLKMPGTGIWDVWFYIEDSLASMYMIYRVYKFMSRVEPSSSRFLNSLSHYLAINTHGKRGLRKVARTLRPVSLKLGPCPVTPMTVLTALDMLGNYYVCVALWD